MMMNVMTTMHLSLGKDYTCNKMRRTLCCLLCFRHAARSLGSVGRPWDIQQGDGARLHGDAACLLIIPAVQIAHFPN